MKTLRELCHRLLGAFNGMKHCASRQIGRTARLAVCGQWKLTVGFKFSGGITGALNNENDPNRQQRNQHANRYYNEVRARNREMEIKTIAKNTGMDKEKIEIAYEHIFINKHKLKKGFQQFDPDYDMAQSWQRLREGKNIHPHDIVLVQHEAAEAKFMAQGCSYNLAHEKACEMGYNYHQELKK